MAWTKYLILIISSLWFFPLSCSTSFIWGLDAAVQHNQINYQPGDPVPNTFAVAIKSSDTPQGFQLKRLHNLASYPASAFQMPRESDSQARGDSESESYKILAQTRDSQTIETRDDEDNYTQWSVYRADAQGIHPISSRQSNMLHGLLLLLALLFSTLLCWFGRFLKQRFALD